MDSFGVCYDLTGKCGAFEPLLAWPLLAAVQRILGATV